jgi:D-galactarolactone cycloisomerase
VFFEEPSAPDADYAGHERLCAALDLPVAGGEMMRTLAEFGRVLERQALDIVQPDLVICGGMRAALLVAELATLYGAACVPHSWNGGVMAAANLQLLAAMPSQVRLTGSSAGLYAEYDTTENPFMRTTIANPPELVDGWVDIPARPGLGVEVDEGALSRYVVESA